MQYMLMIYVDQSAFQTFTPAAQAEGLAAYTAYAEALGKAGVLRANGRLALASAATTVRVVDGKTRVLDGPYSDSKEQLGGYFLIDVPDLDAAIAWAARCPGASHGTVEVRPIWN